MINEATPDRPDVKLASARVISVREVQAFPLPPSEFFRRQEADLIAELARLAHMDGRRFVDWPTIELRSDYDIQYLRDSFHLRAGVKARAL